VPAHAPRVETRSFESIVEEFNRTSPSGKRTFERVLIGTITPPAPVDLQRQIFLKAEFPTSYKTQGGGRLNFEDKSPAQILNRSLEIVFQGEIPAIGYWVDFAIQVGGNLGPAHFTVDISGAGSASVVIPATGSISVVSTFIGGNQSGEIVLRQDSTDLAGWSFFKADIYEVRSILDSGPCQHIQDEIDSLGDRIVELQDALPDVPPRMRPEIIALIAKLRNQLSQMQRVLQICLHAG